MNEVEIYTNLEFGAIRTILIDGEPWFVGKDVADVLGYTNTKKAIRDHVDAEDIKGGNESLPPCDKNVDAPKIQTNGGLQNLVIINESGLYALILSSKLPNARKFKRWITSEVIPSIRKTGRYAQGALPFEERLKIARTISHSNRYNVKAITSCFVNDIPELRSVVDKMPDYDAPERPSTSFKDDRCPVEKVKRVFDNERLRRYLDEKNVNVPELQERVGLSHATISSYTTGKRNPRPAVNDKICAALGLPNDYFYNKEG